MCEVTVIALILSFPCNAGALITAVFFGLNMAFQPYATLSLNRTQATTLVSLFLNLFLGIMLCLSRYMDLERLQACKNEFDDTCTKWKSIERAVVEIIVTIITVAVPLVPIFNFAISSEFSENIVMRVYQFLFKSNVQDGGPDETILFGESDGTLPEDATTSTLGMLQEGPLTQTGPITIEGQAFGPGSGVAALVFQQ